MKLVNHDVFPRILITLATVQWIASGPGFDASTITKCLIPAKHMSILWDETAGNLFSKHELSNFLLWQDWLLIDGDLID